MKLKVGECACTTRGRVYCRTSEGYRFKKGSCSQRGRKISRSS